MKYFLFIVLMGFSALTFAVEEAQTFKNAQQAQLFKELSLELRCPKCQNQNIADSNAVVAKDLRDKVIELVKLDKSKDFIVEYMIDRYGYFVHYKPPVTASTLVLWVVPILFVLFGFGSVIFRQKKSAVEQKWSDKDEAQLTKLISKYQASSAQVKQESGQ
ncbi:MULTISPECIES: cytochrome c-type biogenesis protein [unclassified Pseudoalteromonas]|uniref:cytochrome c-type biogenesis protein n=1 Tax=unclassified Pseudoalteromonas TaxID=194690 RepID=UPI0005A64996|nr:MULTISPECIES: cytochrome c-type biogenesis protein [unclassified Pseudoalteromonas]MBU2969058.1 cytochrome c-type biogenesis protein CcmH [Pseudoalteromonas sp. C2R02]